MMTQKLVLAGVLSAAALCSTPSFAYYHSHHHAQPQYRHHHGIWRNVAYHRWVPPQRYIIVRAGRPQFQIHYHY